MSNPAIVESEALCACLILFKALCDALFNKTSESTS